MQTSVTKPKHIQRHWHLIDLSGQVLGRSATQVASLLQGKHKPYYTAHLDCGDYVVAINASEIKLTGRKSQEKTYFRHSGYPGGAKLTPISKVDPAKIIATAVAGMLPKNKLRDPRLKRLKIFAGPDHKYQDKFKQG